MNFYGALLALTICGLTQADISLKQQQQYYKTGEFQESNYGNSGYQIFEVHNHQQYLPPHQENDDSLDVSIIGFADASNAPVPVPFPSNYQHDFQRQPAATVATPSHQEQTQQSYQAPGYLPPKSATNYQAPDYLPPQKPQQEQVYRAPAYLPPTSTATSTVSAAEYRAPGYLPPGYEFNNPEVKQVTLLQPVQQQQQQQQQQPQTTAATAEYRAPEYLPPGYDFANPDQLPVSAVQSIAPVQQQQHQNVANLQQQPQQHVANVQQQQHVTTVQQQQHVTTVQQQQHVATVQQQQHVATVQQQPQLHVATAQQQQQQHVATVQHQPQVHVATVQHQPQVHAATVEHQQPQHVATVQHQQPQHVATVQQQPQQHVATVQQQPQQHVATVQQQSQQHVATVQQQPQQHVATVQQQPQQHVATVQHQQQQHAATVQQQQQQQHIASVPQNVGKYQAPDYLPPRYEQPKPISYQQHQQQQQQLLVSTTQATLSHSNTLPLSTVHSVTADYRAPDYLPPRYEQPKSIIYQPQQQQQLLVATTQATLSHPGSLPDGYEFTKPENAEAAIAELHSLQTQTKLLKQQQQQQQQQQGNDIVYGKPKTQQQPLAPQTTRATTTLTAIASGTGSSYQAQGYLPPVAPVYHQQQQQFNAPGYLPPAPKPTQVTHIHSLSSYMNTVQPFTRYAQQVPQQHQHQRHQQHQQSPVIEVAPMYREQSKRPRFYAPAMSYVLNALPQKLQPLAPSVLSLQAQQSLQKFMPKDIQMAVNVAVAAAAPTPHPGSSKVRTVQIVKPHAVRTFKVLETLDQAGVKTIKILGATNEQPQGQHHVIKVVTETGRQGVENHVQTVKIYDDQQEFNGYLPPQLGRPRRRIARQAKTLRLLPVPRLL